MQHPRGMDFPPKRVYSAAPEEFEREAAMKKGTSNRSRNKSSRYRAKLKQKHQRVRRRQSGGRKYYR